jgi:alpha-glucosidase
VDLQTSLLRSDVRAINVSRSGARVAAMLLLTLRGTPTLYYGDELGMVDGTIPSALVQDPLELREPGLGRGRDPVRTPMAWDGSAHAGFSTTGPWLPLHGDWPARNVATMADDPDSIWTHRDPPARHDDVLLLRPDEGIILTVG